MVRYFRGRCTFEMDVYHARGFELVAHNLSPDWGFIVWGVIKSDVKC